MQFSIDRKFFYDKLSIVSKAISAFSPLPALSCIYIEIDDKQMILTGSDANVSIQTIIVPGELNQLKVEQVGSIIIDAKYLLEIVRKLDCAIIELQVIDHSLVRISSMNGHFNLNGIEANEYPKIDFTRPNQSFELNAITLKQIISQTAFACSGNDQRPVLTGVNFQADGNTLYCSATDSYRLARKKVELKEPKSFDITISSKSLKEVVSSINDDDNVMIYVDNKKAQFIFDKTIIQIRLIDGKFPNVARTIPSGDASVLDVDSYEIMSTIDRTNFIKNDKIHLIKFDCDEKEVHIKTNSNEIGSSDEILTSSIFKGNDIRLTCNGTYMLEAIKALNCKNVRLEFYGSLRPIKVTDPEDDSILMILVPIKTYD